MKIPLPTVGKRCSALLCACLAWSCAVALAVDDQAYSGLFRRYNEAMHAGRFQLGEQLAGQMLDAADTPSRKAASLNSLGRALLAQGKAPEAEQKFRQALALPLDPDNTNRGWIPCNLGLAFVAQQRLPEAEAQFQQALKIFQQISGESSSEVAATLNYLGGVAQQQQKLDQALDYHRRALEMREAIFGPRHEQVSQSLLMLGETYFGLKRYAEAEGLFKRALTIREQAFGPTHHEVAGVCQALGVLYRELENYPAAETYDRRSLAIREQLFSPQDAKVQQSLRALAEDLERQSRREEAAALRRRAAEGRHAAPADNPAPSNRAPEPAKLIWQDFSPPGGEIRMRFPGPPRYVKRAVDGVDHPIYYFDSPQARFLLSYFESPADTAPPSYEDRIAAYAKARQGTLESQQAVNLHGCQGREFLVRLPKETLVRMRLLETDQRWYQVSVEGPRDVVTGVDAREFLDSFEPRK